MSIEIRIRVYQPGDEAAIRTIACDTANLGNLVEPIFSDRETVADLLTRYYTAYEPQRIWVGESGQRVVGYLTGCFDSRRYRWIMVSRIVPRVVLGAVSRGALRRQETWRLLTTALANSRRGRFRYGSRLKNYPAHLHINILDEFRHRHLGQKLVQRFLEQVRQNRLPGVHAAVRSDNETACGFFRRMEFKELHRLSITLPAVSGGSDEIVIFGKQV